MKKEADYNRNDFWEFFTGKPAHKFLNREIITSSSPLGGTQKADFFLNEIGFFFRVRNSYGLIGTNFAIRFHKTQFFNIQPQVCDYVAHRFLGDKVCIKLFDFSAFTDVTEIIVNGISSDEMTLIDQVIKKGRG